MYLYVWGVAVLELHSLPDHNKGQDRASKTDQILFLVIYYISKLTTIPNISEPQLLLE